MINKELELMRENKSITEEEYKKLNISLNSNKMSAIQTINLLSRLFSRIDDLENRLIEVNKQIKKLGNIINKMNQE